MLGESFTAWAIRTRSSEGHGFIGRYWWFDRQNQRGKIPAHMEGCEIALFETRRIARENLPDVKGAFSDAQVVKVKVSVEIQ